MNTGEVCIEALTARCAQLMRERDEALAVRDRAREASNRDLEAKRLAEAEIARLRLILSKPTCLHATPFEYDPTPYAPGEHCVVLRSAPSVRPEQP